MSITVRIEDEDGSPQADTWWQSDSSAILVGDHPGTCCLRFIDAYGDTVFNQAQLPVLVDELRALQAGLRNRDHAFALAALCEFIESAIDQVHTYVRFLGD